MNGRSSCAFHALCTCILTPGCIYCCFYKVAIARYILLLDEFDPDRVKPQISFTAYSFSNKAPIYTTNAQSAIELYKPPESMLTALRSIHRLYQSKTIWIIDIEFYQPRHHQAVLFCIAVRDAKTDNIVLRTIIYYKSVALTEIERRIETLGYKVFRWGKVEYLEEHWYHQTHAWHVPSGGWAISNRRWLYP